jgi:hypothetical protein
MRGFFILAAFLCVATPSVRAIVIDDFTVGPIHLERNAGVAVSHIQTGLDPAHVLGGQREIVLGQFYENGQVLDIDTSAQRMSLTSAPFPALAGLDVTYGSRTVPLGIDLTAEGHDRFVFDFVGALPSCCSSFRVTSATGSALQIDSVDLENYYDGNVATIPFSEFSGVDFTNVASLELDFGRHRGFVLGAIYTIPEPMTAWLPVGAMAAACITRFCRR